MSFSENRFPLLRDMLWRSRPARRCRALTLPMRLHKSIQRYSGSTLASPAEVIMSFRVSGKNLDVGEALRERINSRIGDAMSKYFDGGYSGHVTVAREDSGFRTECAVHLDSRITLRAEASAPDAYESADQAALRVEKQLRRYHRRLKDHRC
jgi:ribosomal subunit interface protein